MNETKAVVKIVNSCGDGIAFHRAGGKGTVLEFDCLDLYGGWANLDSVGGDYYISDRTQPNNERSLPDVDIDAVLEAVNKAVDEGRAKWVDHPLWLENDVSVEEIEEYVGAS